MSLGLSLTVYIERSDINLSEIMLLRSKSESNSSFRFGFLQISSIFSLVAFTCCTLHHFPGTFLAHLKFFQCWCNASKNICNNQQSSQTLNHCHFKFRKLKQIVVEAPFVEGNKRSLRSRLSQTKGLKKWQISQKNLGLGSNYKLTQQSFLVLSAKWATETRDLMFFKHIVRKGLRYSWIFLFCCLILFVAPLFSPESWFMPF